MVRDERLTPDNVTEVLALVDPIVPTLLVHPKPRTVAEARFSLQYCLAAILADGRLSLQHFTPPSLERADLRDIGRRIRMEIHPELVSHKGVWRMARSTCGRATAAVSAVGSTTRKGAGSAP